MEVHVGFAESAEVKTAGKALGCERVIQKSGELEIKTEGKEEGKGEIEEVSPQKRGEATQSD